MKHPEILKEMTLEEKAAILSGKTVFDTMGIERLWEKRQPIREWISCSDRASISIEALFVAVILNIFRKILIYLGKWQLRMSEEFKKKAHQHVRNTLQ